MSRTCAKPPLDLLGYTFIDCACGRNGRSLHDMTTIRHSEAGWWAYWQGADWRQYPSNRPPHRDAWLIGWMAAARTDPEQRYVEEVM